MTRYGAVAAALHWAIAAAIALNLWVGWWMGDAIADPAMKSAAIAAFQLHKSVGLTVLVLSLLRLGWRLAHATPALPPMPDWQRHAARLTHWGLYALMVGLPLSGWLYVSTQWRDGAPLNVPTLWFGLFHVPHLFGLDTLEPAARGHWAGTFGEAHAWLAYGMAALMAVHVGAALKHRFVDRDTVLSTMRPGLGAGVVLLTVVAIVATGARSQGGAPVAATQAGSATGSWIVQPGSAIAFTGSNAGSDFHGRFTQWTADLRYDPAHPEAASLRATVRTGSATTGVPMQDEALPQAEWFDAAKFPTAEFVSTAVGADGAITGTLTIKGHPLPVTGLVASFADGVLKIAGHTAVDRKAADLGLQSDATGEYVSMTIGVDVDVTAKAP